MVTYFVLSCPTYCLGGIGNGIVSVPENFRICTFFVLHFFRVLKICLKCQQE